MDPITAIIEIAKVGLQVYVSYMRQAGLNEEQINQVFEASRQGMLRRDPANIPN